MNETYFWILALILWNMAVFLLYGLDKRRAIEGKWRISERTLLLAALAGGALGARLGMKHFHHKTKHKKFVFLVPLFLILQIIALFLWFCRQFSFL